MPKKTVRFTNAAVTYYFDDRFAGLKNFVDQKAAVLLIDEQVFAAHHNKFKGWNTILLKSGEAYKNQATVDRVIVQLIEMGADRGTTLIGIGGGVVTDLTGYIAAVFLRGVSFDFVPTTLLALVDASIGGKNGVDVGVYKNMVGTIRQPAFILYDLQFLTTLPEPEWHNGFAEIIKHGAIKDATLFRQLEATPLLTFQKKKPLLAELIKRNVLLKTGVVQRDEFEKGERKLLNFGHTLGHALEKEYNLMHGEAVAIGVVFAANLSAQLTGFKQTERFTTLLQQYGLPVSLPYDKEQVFKVLQSDKKKAAGFMHFILLQKVGKAVIEKIPLEKIYNYL